MNAGPSKPSAGRRPPRLGRGGRGCRRLPPPLSALLVAETTSQPFCSPRWKHQMTCSKTLASDKTADSNGNC